MRIVVLDGHTLNPGDLGWEPLGVLGETEIYDRTPEDQVVERAKSADILIVNKVVLDASILQRLPHLKFICVSATGFNNVDIEAARARSIPVSNVRAYSTASVAQHVFATLLHVIHRVDRYNAEAHDGHWSTQADFSYWHESIVELSGQTLGIYGFGRIGQRVAEIGQAFGMDVIAHHKHAERDRRAGVTFVDQTTLFRMSDVLTLHAPLTQANKNIVNADRLRSMKSSAILINTARGGLIAEADLKTALQEKWLRAAALDVLSVEPPPADHPLFGVENCFITPHQAWASRASRQRLLNGVIDNIRAFQAGRPRHVVWS